MRRLPAMENAWRNNDFIGDNRPVIRATIVRPQMKLYTYGLQSLGTDKSVTIKYNDLAARNYLATDPARLFKGEDVSETYATHWVHADYQPLELPNIKTCEWQRSIDQDAAEMTLTMLNVMPVEPGTVLGPGRPLKQSSPGQTINPGDGSYDMDQLGYFSPSRGTTTDSVRWGHKPNPWAGLLMPDNMIRTYQGYGVDWDQQPESDPHLALTGVWLIDDINFTAAGTIQIRCRDLGRLLLQQGFEAPVLPNDFNPTGFKAWTTADLTRTVNIETPTLVEVKKEYTWSDPPTTGRTRLPLTHPTSSSYFWRVGTNGSGGPGTIKDPLNYHGRGPQHTLDDDGSTFWISVGNSSPRASFAYEWVEFDLPGSSINEVVVHTAKAGYTAYVSVMQGGKWLGPQKINYREAGVGRNNSNIPFLAQQAIPNENRQTIKFAPVDKAQKLRVTLGNLQDWSKNFGSPAFRGAIRTIEAYATQSAPGSVHKEFRTEKVPGTKTDTRTIVLPPGAVGENPGTGAARYSDFTDIVQLICAWGGFYWPQDATEALSNSTRATLAASVKGTKPAPTFRRHHFDTPDTDVLGHVPGRVWGDFMSTGQSGPAPIDASNFKAKSLMDGIHYFQDIVSYNFWIDETGACQWRYPNIDTIGNWVTDGTNDVGREDAVWEIDEKQLLTDFSTTLSSRRVAEIVILKNLVSKHGFVSSGYNPNPTGLRRSVIWNDAEHLVSDAEAVIMGDLVATRMLFNYRTTTFTVPGFAGLQIDDQVRIHERTSSDSFYHLITAISSSHDNDTGSWTMNLNTMWLGDTPEGRWTVPRRSRTTRESNNIVAQPVVTRVGRSVRPTS